MSYQKSAKKIIVAISHFFNQPLFARETVLNPVKFWHIYQNQQMLEECWQYDIIQSLEECWHLPENQLLNNCLPSENDSQSIIV
ncbi:hypothetical protein [Anabaena sp. CA = ATCC 33047]|uniref:hypothetical protein n=1 Tax=Anabaena sp. (strain CA / ATCC 33047) TaxID=52271 RepID=UPI00082DE6AB|nr:hypothetical protein [Anabaena sp. CA = ATCC 33047]